MARPRELTAERAREALRRHHRRLLDKSESGNLTAGEVRQLRDFAEKPATLDGGSRKEWAKNYTALAQEVGYTRQQLLNIRKAYKDDPRLPKTRANGAHNVSAWMQFLDAVGGKSGLQRAQGSNGTGADDDPPLPRKARLELERIELQLEEQTFRLQRDRGSGSGKTWLKREFPRVSQPSSRISIGSSVEIFRPLLRGQPAAKISKALREEIDRGCPKNLNFEK